MRWVCTLLSQHMEVDMTLAGRKSEIGDRPRSLPLIDGHNHVGGPDLIDRKAQSAAEIVRRLDLAGVDKAVIFPFNNPHPTEGFKSANNYIAKAVADFPSRLIGFGRVDPTNPAGAVQEVERIGADLNLAGIKLHPRAQEFMPDHPGLLAVLKKMSELDLVVVFDSGSAFAPWPEMAELANKFPDIPMIMAHMRQGDYIDAAKSAPNIYLGTTKVQPKLIVDAVKEIGADRIISGSDSPYVSIEAEINKIRSLDGLSESDKSNMLGLNMARILCLQTSPQAKVS